MYTSVEVSSELNEKQFKNFELWFDKEIGTEYEINRLDNGKYNVVCFDLTKEEFIKLATWEALNA